MRLKRVFLTNLGAIFCIAASAQAGPVDDFIAAARAKHGDAGARAAEYLAKHMPETDRATLSAAFLQENLDLAFQARQRFPWAAKVPEPVFLNDVLPYAVLDETRDAWRAQFLKLAGEIVQDCKTTAEAAQALNRELFKKINVHYNTGRKRANQSPKESMELGMATCTGLSVILVDACRSVGIPARAVGTPMWDNNRGNHTWVEIWDEADGKWHFTGADEYDPKGLDRGWFIADAAKANLPDHGIFASSWRRDRTTFPMVWAPENTSVGAEDVTARYAQAKPPAAAVSKTTRLGIRLLAAKQDSKSSTGRIAASVEIRGADGKLLGTIQTTAGTADLNDIARIELPEGTKGSLRFIHDKETRELPFGPVAAGDPVIDAVWPELH